MIYSLPGIEPSVFKNIGREKTILDENKNRHTLKKTLYVRKNHSKGFKIMVETSLALMLSNSILFKIENLYTHYDVSKN